MKLPPFGSLLGMIQGFTQWGVTGTASPPGAKLPEFDGLNASAVAVALTVFVARDQIRENSVGRLLRETCTVTSGLTPNWESPGTAVQFTLVDPVPEE